MRVLHAAQESETSDIVGSVMIRENGLTKNQKKFLKQRYGWVLQRGEYVEIRYDSNMDLLLCLSEDFNFFVSLYKNKSGKINIPLNLRKIRRLKVIITELSNKVCQLEKLDR